MSKEQTIEDLSKLLADTYLFYLKTHNFHWNVEGPEFFQIHTQLETQYTELAMAVDEIAERIRALGKPAPASFAEFKALAKIDEAPGKLITVTDVVQSQLHDHEIFVENLRQFSARVEADPASQALFDERLAYHEKAAWMLRSSQR